MKIIINVKPNSFEDSVEKKEDGSFIVRVKERAQDGKANEKVIRLLSKHFRVSASEVKIKNFKSRRRRFEEVYPYEEGKGVRGFLKRIEFLLSSLAEVEMHYTTDEQLYAMRRLAMQRNPRGIKYLNSLLFVDNNELVNVKGNLKNELRLVDNPLSIYRLDNIVDSPEKFHLAETFEIARLSRKFSFLSFSVD